MHRSRSIIRHFNCLSATLRFRSTQSSTTTCPYSESLAAFHTAVTDASQRSCLLHGREDQHRTLISRGKSTKSGDFSQVHVSHPQGLSTCRLQEQLWSQTRRNVVRGGSHGFASQPSRDGELVVIALGSNVGDGVDAFRSAVRRMNQAGVRVVRHSCLYETKAAYVTDQPNFLNGAVLARTTLPPEELLSTLKAVERDEGREDGGLRWGPRPLDLDIIVYGNRQLQTENLTIPHLRFEERDFVLAPAADLYARGGLEQTGELENGCEETSALYGAVERWKARGGAGVIGGPDIRRVSPSGVPGGVLGIGGRTQVMGILNVTPDSFSDGGLHYGLDAAVTQAQAMVAAGADMIDIGGQSTRPGAARVEPEEELRRVLPVLRALSAPGRLCRPAGDPHDAPVLLSVDTFYARVAREAVAAGAHIINDVSGGTLDPDMFRTVAELERAVPYVLMHMRGDPTTMQSAGNTTYADVCADVAAALDAQARKAVEAGVMPWQIWADPGIGFAKTHEGNFELLRGLRRVSEHLEGGPLRSACMLVGPSRKGFLGTATGRKLAGERDWATAAALAASVAGGADVVRAHNVTAARDTVRTADAIWRQAK